MLRQRHELRIECALTTAFAALLAVAARGRWGAGAAELGTLMPRVGLNYAQQRRTVFRRGRVLECLRPVSLTLAETLLDSPCCVELRLRWRIEPCEVGVHMLLEARFSLNGAATLRRAHWRANIRGHCERMLAAIERHSKLAAANNSTAPEPPAKRDVDALAQPRSMYTRDNGAALAVPQSNAEPEG